jgi:hypothetical protein
VSDIMQIEMTAEEARICIDNINTNLRNTRALLLDLYERQGWKALGYESWRACVTGEFKEKQTYLYYQLAAARAEKNLSTIVETPIGTIREAHLRPLASLPPDQQREAYQKALETAPEGKITAKHMEFAVTVIKHIETHPVIDAMAFAGVAISYLERIPDNDPFRMEAFQKVITWCNNNISR